MCNDQVDCMRGTTHIRFDRSRRTDTRRSRASAFVYALIAIGATFVKQSLAVSSRRRVHARHPAVSQQARSSCGLVPTGSPRVLRVPERGPPTKVRPLNRITPPEAAKSMDETR